VVVEGGFGKDGGEGGWGSEGTEGPDFEALAQPAQVSRIAITPTVDRDDHSGRRMA